MERLQKDYCTVSHSSTVWYLFSSGCVRTLHQITYLGTHSSALTRLQLYRTLRITVFSDAKRCLGPSRTPPSTSSSGYEAEEVLM